MSADHPVKIPRHDPAVNAVNVDWLPTAGAQIGQNRICDGQTTPRLASKLAHRPDRSAPIADPPADDLQHKVGVDHQAVAPVPA